MPHLIDSIQSITVTTHRHPFPLTIISRSSSTPSAPFALYLSISHTLSLSLSLLSLSLSLPLSLPLFLSLTAGRGYSPVIHQPISTTVFGHTYVGVGGSSSGGAAVAGILKFLQSFAEPLASQGGEC